MWFEGYGEFGSFLGTHSYASFWSYRHEVDASFWYFGFNRRPKYTNQSASYNDRRNLRLLLLLGFLPFALLAPFATLLTAFLRTFTTFLAALLRPLASFLRSFATLLRPFTTFFTSLPALLTRFFLFLLRGLGTFTRFAFLPFLLPFLATFTPLLLFLFIFRP